ncbi:MAG TPA: hypothetical protein PK727_03895 [Bacteroidales bacterium]|jgi:hypothetical protein|nr:hypothetical protein [Bacteroidales bacterium]HOG56450.1 hypothetical protein [Bacteroidales bacterium]HPX43760.1 hypothetical protein [Bacteroidales bacterium]HQB86202.1 hypothetical protein [Bacteroidales bacterium]
MNVTVNDIQLELYEGARVKDAVFKYYSNQGTVLPKAMPVVVDQSGNIIDKDSRLTEGTVLYISLKKPKRSFFRGMFP